MEQPAAPEDHETEDPEDGDGGAEAAVLEQSLSLYLSKSIFGYETANESEDDSDGEPERKENEPDNDEGVQDMDQQNPLSKVVFEDPYIPFRMHSAHSTEIKYRRLAISENPNSHPRKLKLYGKANVARNFIQSQQLFTEQLYSNNSVRKGLFSLKVQNMFPRSGNDIPSNTLINLFMIGADAMPRTAETTSTLVLLAQGGNPGLSKNPGLMRQLLVGDIDEKSEFMRKYFAEQLNPYAKLLDCHPEQLIFSFQPNYKQAIGWPADTNVEAQNFPFISCLNEFVVVPDLKSMGEICGDAGVTNAFPLGTVAVEKKQFGNSLLVLVDRNSELPNFMSEGIATYLVNPTKGNQLLDICYFRTAEEIDALWDDLEQKANSIIKASPEKFGDATFEELRDSNDPMVKKLYDSLRKKLFAYANEKSHAFVHHRPPSHVNKCLRNCGMHVDHNFAKRILVFLVCLSV